jgi:hypothetical protein
MKGRDKSDDGLKVMIKVWLMNELTHAEGSVLYDFGRGQTGKDRRIK